MQFLCSLPARSLILKALRKKHFYKETIRIDRRLLPHEQLNSTKVILNDWIGWDSESCKGDLPSSETNWLELSSSKDQRPNSPIYGVIQESHRNPDVSVIVKPSKEPTSNNEIPSQTKDETVQEQAQPTQLPKDHCALHPFLLSFHA
jgi:ribonuclease P/MRP protein subunit RPP1